MKRSEGATGSDRTRAVSKETVERPGGDSNLRRRRSPASQFALVLVGSRQTPQRIGEVLLLPSRKPFVVGRFDPEALVPGEEWAIPVRQRPGATETVGPLELPDHVSRRQLRLLAERDGVRVVVEGKAGVRVDDEMPLPAGEDTLIQPGTTISIEDELCLFLTTRPPTLPPVRARQVEEWSAFGFGEADVNGMVGESPAIWSLRDRLAFVAGMSQHVLLVGPSGTGKEMAAAAVHRLSPRAGKALVAHSAADIPPTLLEAELFGNRADYPQAGMPPRAGLIATAHGSTLFLDELGTLPVDLQARLLRVLDEGGRFRRLGSDEPQVADFRLVTATNQPPELIKHDLRARLEHLVEIPSLNERREDIPLVAQRLLLRMSERAADRRQVERFWDRESRRFRISIELIRALVRHDYSLNVRELEQLLLASIFESESEELERTSSVESRLRLPQRSAERETTVEPAAIHAALDREDGNVAAAARRLGVSRFQLIRLMRKHGIVRSSPASDEADDE
ncbi:MAG: sigma 54-interacting transcriptional regulator [Candidatus Eisenbacteria bacterium]